MKLLSFHDLTKAVVKYQPVVIEANNGTVLIQIAAKRSVVSKRSKFGLAITSLVEGINTPPSDTGGIISTVLTGKPTSNQMTISIAFQETTSWAGLKTSMTVWGTMITCRCSDKHLAAPPADSLPKAWATISIYPTTKYEMI